MTDFLTLAEAAARCKFSVKTLRRAIKAKRLAYSQPNGSGGRILISESALAAWLSSAPLQVVSPPSVSVGVRPYVSRRYA